MSSSCDWVEAFIKDGLVHAFIFIQLSCDLVEAVKWLLQLEHETQSHTCMMDNERMNLRTKASICWPSATASGAGTDKRNGM
jgi:hypothetical protein